MAWSFDLSAILSTYPVDRIEDMKGIFFPVGG